MSETCWQCGGEGHLGSDCIDDCCHGGDIPCAHGDETTIPCDVCEGRGELRDDSDDGHYGEEMADAAEALRDGTADARSGFIKFDGIAPRPRSRKGSHDQRS